MKIGLIGFGKTGKAVAAVILQNPDLKLEWVFRQQKVLEHRNVSEFLDIKETHSNNEGLIYSSENISMDKLTSLHPVDAIIDFSSAQGIYSYGEDAAKKKIKIISAISHYAEKELLYLKKLAKDTVVFWSPNITLGVNYLLFSAKFLKKIALFVDIEIIEEHYKGKEGVSGTALKLADVLELERKDINSVRAGGIVGKHEIIFGFPYQTVRLVHESISREAFGNGVIFVAENLKTEQPGLYNFEDVLLPFFSR